MNKTLHLTAIVIAIIVATVVFAQTTNAKQYSPESQEVYNYNV